MAEPTETAGNAFTTSSSPEHSRRPEKKSVVVLASGRGSNLQALLQHQHRNNYRITAVLSDKADAQALQRAREAGISAIDLEWSNRQQGEANLRQQLHALQPDWIVLAGFMRVLSADTVNAWLGRMINIHPSLLPLYPGLHTHQRVIDDGQREHGASVHFVTAELDGGPVISQTRLPVLPEDTAESLARRLLPREHRLLAQTVHWLCNDSVQLADSRVLYNGTPLEKPLVVP